MCCIRNQHEVQTTACLQGSSKKAQVKRTTKSWEDRERMASLSSSRVAAHHLNATTTFLRTELPLVGWITLDGHSLESGRAPTMALGGSLLESPGEGFCAEYGGGTR